MNGKPWLQSDTDTLTRMNAVGYRDQEIAAVTGHAKITIFYRRKALGLSPARRERRFTSTHKPRQVAGSASRCD